jgi:hypothetical protein
MLINRKRKPDEATSRMIKISSAWYSIEYCPETGDLFSAYLQGQSEKETDEHTLDWIQEEINENIDIWELEDQREQRDEALISRWEE